MQAVSEAQRGGKLQSATAANAVDQSTAVDRAADLSKGSTVKRGSRIPREPRLVGISDSKEPVMLPSLSICVKTD